MFTQTVQYPNAMNLGYAVNYADAPFLKARVNSVPTYGVGHYGLANNLNTSVNKLSAGDFLNWPTNFNPGYLINSGNFGPGLGYDPSNLGIGFGLNGVTTIMPWNSAFLTGNSYYNDIIGQPYLNQGLNSVLDAQLPLNFAPNAGLTFDSTMNPVTGQANNPFMDTNSLSNQSVWGRTVIPQGVLGICPIHIVDNDTELVYEFFMPSITSSNLDVSIVQNEIRVRLAKSKTSLNDVDSKGTLICRLPVPNFVDISKITAKVLNDGRICIIAPRGSEFTKMIRKVKVS